MSDRTFVYTDDLCRHISNISCQSNRHVAYQALTDIPIHTVSEITTPLENQRTIGLRWFSMLNEWMDCLILVQNGQQEAAVQAICDGIERFWDEDCLCYGDCIEEALNERGVQFLINYLDEHAFTQESWERYVQSFEAVGIPVINL